MTIVRYLAVFLTIIVTTSARADLKHIEQVDRSFIGILDVQARYGGYDEWVKAAWGSSDTELEFELSEGWPFESKPRTLKATQFGLLETSYEFPSILVYKRNDDLMQFNDWIQVKIDEELTWMRMKPGDVYQSHTSLFDEGRLSYLMTRDIELSDLPGGESTSHNFKPADQKAAENDFWTPEANVIGRAEIVHFDPETGRRSTEHWLRIRIRNQSSCEGPTEDPENLAEGWIPARQNNNGEIAVWYYSRGC